MSDRSPTPPQLLDAVVVRVCFAAYAFRVFFDGPGGQPEAKLAIEGPFTLTLPDGETIQIDPSDPDDTTSQQAIGVLGAKVSSTTLSDNGHLTIHWDTSHSLRVGPPPDNPQYESWEYVRGRHMLVCPASGSVAEWGTGFEWW